MTSLPLRLGRHSQLVLGLAEQGGGSPADHTAVGLNLRPTYSTD